MLTNVLERKLNSQRFKRNNFNNSWLAKNRSLVSGQVVTLVIGQSGLHYLRDEIMAGCFAEGTILVGECDIGSAASWSNPSE